MFSFIALNIAPAKMLAVFESFLFPPEMAHRINDMMNCFAGTQAMVSVNS
jgi:hypothetical protein